MYRARCSHQTPLPFYGMVNINAKSNLPIAIKQSFIHLWARSLSEKENQMESREVQTRRKIVHAYVIPDSPY